MFTYHLIDDYLTQVKVSSLCGGYVWWGGVPDMDVGDI
jgi:hypothetical protein